VNEAKFKYRLKNNDLVTCFDGTGYYNGDKKVFSFNEEDGTKFTFNMNDLILTRENYEMLLTFDFNNGNSFIQMKQLENKIELPVKIIDIKLEPNKFMANYNLSENNNFEFIIEWTLGGE